MATDTDKLTPRQTQIVTLLVAGKSIEDAAKQLGISTQAIDYHLRKPEVREGLKRAKNAIYESVLSRLTRLGMRAVDELEKIFNDANTPPSARVAAAKVTLENLARYRAIDLGERLETLEQQIEEMTNDK